MSKFHTVAIPNTLYDEVKEMIFKKEWLGYRNVNEYVRNAVRNQVERDMMKTSHQKKFEEDFM